MLEILKKSLKILNQETNCVCVCVCVCVYCEAYPHCHTFPSVQLLSHV